MATKRNQESKAKTINGKPTMETSTWPPEVTWQRIASKAYDLYKQRGCRDGYDLQDWLDAEYLLNEEIYEVH